METLLGIIIILLSFLICLLNLVMVLLYKDCKSKITNIDLKYQNKNSSLTMAIMEQVLETISEENKKLKKDIKISNNLINSLNETINILKNKLNKQKFIEDKIHIEKDHIPISEEMLKTREIKQKEETLKLNNLLNDPNMKGLY